MSETKHCEKKAVNNSLVKKDWEEGIRLSNICYMNVKNPLDKLSKQAKNTNIEEDVENEVTYEEDKSTKIELSEAIKMLAKIFYEREYDFFNQICLAAQPLERSSQTMDRMKKLMLFICYLLASLHNSKINVFKFDIANYLDLVSTSNKGINTMANFGVILTTRSVNPINPKIIDYELIARHLDKRFIVNLGVPYYFHSQDSKKICFEDELIDKLTVHSYNDRIENKTNNQHIWDSILFDFIKNNLKGVVGYINVLRVVHNQELMQEYLFNNSIPIIADWLGQFYIRKAIAHQYLLNNETIPSFVTSFLPMMGPLHISLNARELIFVQNSVLFNDVHKGIF
ncbi:45280_t:CDS:2, partial [Gigaspora margarita]